MYQSIHRITYGFLGILLLLALAGMVKGCERKHNSTGPQGQPTEIVLTIAKPAAVQAKATGYYLKAVGVEIGEDQVEREIGPTIGPIEIKEDLTFPFSIPVTLLVPPCLYRFTWWVTLIREDVREKSAVFDVCEQDEIDLSILTFEEFQVYEQPINAPDPVIGGATIEVSCGTDLVSAPDSDRWPLTAQLWEEGGESVNGSFDARTAVSGSFPDPFPQESLAGERVFYCTIRDGRSPEQSFTKTITRLPDVDGDGIPDEGDNYPSIPNPTSGTITIASNTTISGNTSTGLITLTEQL